MPNWKDYPHDEKCPCCGYDMRYAEEYTAKQHIYVEECLSCGHYKDGTEELEQVDESEFDEDDE